jgi:hypothetical protein
LARDDAHENSKSCTSSTRRPNSESLRSFRLCFSESHLGASLPLVTWYTFTPLGAETRSPEYSPADMAAAVGVRRRRKSASVGGGETPFSFPFVAGLSNFGVY